jgi:hypothetical protein
MDDIKWTKKEKSIARKAFDKAFEKECLSITDNIKNMINEVSCPEDLWKIRDYLSKTLRNIEKKYDFRYSILILVLAQLIRDEWIEENDLIGLDEYKISKIVDLANGQYL